MLRPLFMVALPLFLRVVSANEGPFRPEKDDVFENRVYGESSTVSTGYLRPDMPG
jgi:hypothetical protein